MSPVLIQVQRFKIFASLTPEKDQFSESLDEVGGFGAKKTQCSTRLDVQLVCWYAKIERDMNGSFVDSFFT